MASDRSSEIERAMPADVVPGSFLPAESDALVRLRDGTWLSMAVLGWRRDTAGRWCVQLRWHMMGVSTVENWFGYDPALVRPAGSLNAGPGM